MSQVDEVVDTVDEPAEHIATEERMVALLGSDGEFIVELVGERSGFLAVLRHARSVASIYTGAVDRMNGPNAFGSM
jgi:hypothetical protein